MHTLDVLERYRTWLHAQPGVVWVGRGARADVHIIRVGVVPGHAPLPPAIEGVRIELVYERNRPCFCGGLAPGSSIGTLEGTKAHSGSVGFFVTDGQKIHAITASHLWRRAGISLDVYHPSPAHAGKMRKVGILANRVMPGSPMIADAAAILLGPDVQVDSVAGNTAIMGIADPEEGMTVHKTGAVTGTTMGRITDCDVSLDFGDGWAIHRGFWVSSWLHFSRVGDSGGPVYTPDGRVVGLVTGAGDSFIVGRTFCSYARQACVALGFGAQPRLAVPIAQQQVYVQQHHH